MLDLNNPPTAVGGILEFSNTLYLGGLGLLDSFCRWWYFEI